MPAHPFLTNRSSGYRERRGHILVTTPVWRSMVGFDLAQSLSNYPGLARTRKLPGEFGAQHSLLSDAIFSLRNGVLYCVSSVSGVRRVHPL
ncbi:MAG TPA: hypothetical protein VNN62_18925 [Methylomirabilota bacterium]|nr:hypothetical protein [Methylomirabilota bacterium]